MPVTPEAAARILDALNAASPVTHRKMFGGIGIYSEGVFFAVIDNDELYFKVGPTNEAAYQRDDSQQWIIAGDEPSPMPYWSVPSAVLQDPTQLAEWIKAAVEVATAKKSKKKK